MASKKLNFLSQINLATTHPRLITLVRHNEHQLHTLAIALNSASKHYSSMLCTIYLQYSYLANILVKIYAILLLTIN